MIRRATKTTSEEQDFMRLALEQWNEENINFGIPSASRIGMERLRMMYMSVTTGIKRGYCLLWYPEAGLAPAGMTMVSADEQLDHWGENLGEAPGYVHAAYVRPEYRGTDGANALALAALEEARVEGFTAVRGCVTVSNKAAYAFFERVGVTPYSVNVAYKL